MTSVVRVRSASLQAFTPGSWQVLADQLRCLVVLAYMPIIMTKIVHISYVLVDFNLWKLLI